MIDFYIAGPMRGYVENNFPAFYDCEKVLNQAGFTTINPAALDDEIDPESKYQHFTKSDLPKFMARDLPKLLECGAVILLPGWQDSLGACIESFVGFMCGLEIYTFNPSLGSWQFVDFEEFLPTITRKMIIEMMEYAY